MNSCLKLDNAIIITLGSFALTANSCEPSQIANTDFVNSRALPPELVNQIIAAVRGGKSK